MTEFLREKTLRWFGHVQTRDKDDAKRQLLQVTVNGKRTRGSPKRRWRDVVKDDMARNEMTTEMADDRTHWHVMIRAGTLRRVEADMWEGDKSLVYVDFAHSSLRATPCGTGYRGTNCDVMVGNGVLICLPIINCVGLYRMDGIGVAR